jgi:hypothetical protein
VVRIAYGQMEVSVISRDQSALGPAGGNCPPVCRRQQTFTTRGDQLARIWRGMQARAHSLFSIDSRALATFRVAIAAILLLDLVVRSTALVAHYTDLGVLPRPARITAYEFDGESTARFWWSLHMMNGSGWFQIGLFALAAWLAVWLLLGYRTRLATLGSWVLLVSLHSRLPTVNQGGDVLLRCLLFWSMFVPLGATLSIDRAQSIEKRNYWSRSVYSMGTVCLLLQLPLMYWFSAAAKNHTVWNQEYTAVYYALELDLYAKPAGVALRQYTKLLQVLTFATYWWEWIGPALAFIPWGTRRWRLLTVAAFWLFHCGLALTLHLGLFSYVAMTGWLLFLPSEFWDALSTRIHKLLPALDRMFARSSRKRLLQRFRSPNSPYFALGRATSLLLALVFVGVVISNAYLMQAANAPLAGPAWLHNLVAAIRMEQQWLLFAPRPGRNDGWCVMRGVLVDGTEVNLWQPGQPLPWLKPKSMSSLFPNHRWRKLIVNLCWESDNEELSCFSDWLCWRWNNFYTDGAAEKMVQTVEIIYQRERTPLPGRPRTPVVSVPLWHWDYGPEIVPDDPRPVHSLKSTP